MIDLSAAELLALDSQVQFQGERIVHVQIVTFSSTIGISILGTVYNPIYDVALQISCLSRSDGGAITTSQIGINRPEEEWFGGQILASVSDSRELSNSLTGIEDLDPYAPSGLQIVFGNEGPNAPDVSSGFR